MTQEELNVIIEKHEKWLKGQDGGERADLSCSDLSYSNLRGSDLSCSDLSYSNLRGSDLSYSNLRGSDLSGSDLRGSDLSYSNLSGSDLRGSDLSCCDLSGCDLSYSNLSGSDLRGSDLSCCDLSGCNLRGAMNVPHIPMTCPDSGSFTAWKKAHGHIVKLLIPDDARRSSATGRKCRCDKAVVVAIETVYGEPSGLDEIASDYDDSFIYKIGKTVTEPNFCKDRFRECADGIHFFINRQEAVDYN